MASCGAVVGTAKIVAISPSSLVVAGATVAMPGVPPTASSSFCSWASFSAAPFGMSTARRNGPFEPAPNAALNSSYATRWVRDSGWLPSSGWPRRICVTGKAKISSTTTPAAIETHGRAVTRSPQRSNARDGSTCSGFFGFSQRANAPIMIGRIVIADTTTAPTAIAEARPSLPMNGMPITSRPAIATMTMSPAATTDAPDVAAALAAASRVLLPAAACSR